MTTARHASGAVHIPALGDLVLGGYGCSGKLRTAELLQVVGVSDGSAPVWKEISPMNIHRSWPSAVHFDGSIYVASWEASSVEMLSLPAGQPGQWTLLSESDTLTCRPSNICVYNKCILLVGQSKAGEVH